ncbi:MAG: PA2779 family protein, partial [Deltaproteobacteria bacterium]|nr:PA2779 family protein [Deltaproteobacteria bacterium]
MHLFKNALLLRRIAIILVVPMALISIVPQVEAAFISSDESFSYNMRQQDTATIKKALEQKLVKQRLKTLGYSEDEVKARLDKLSENELHRFATQLDALKAGGGLGGILVLSAVIVGLLMLILYL